MCPDKGTDLTSSTIVSQVYYVNFGEFRPQPFRSILRIGGQGGGGNGSTNGETNKGGGGGGGNSNASSGGGGKGICIIRYQLP